MFRYMYEKDRRFMMCLVLWPVVTTLLTGFAGTSWLHYRIGNRPWDMGDFLMGTLTLAGFITVYASWSLVLRKLCDGAGYIGWLRGKRGDDLPGRNPDHEPKLPKAWVIVMPGSQEIVH